MTTTKVECGAAGKLSVPEELPCVRRLRHRRLLTSATKASSPPSNRTYVSSVYLIACLLLMHLARVRASHARLLLCCRMIQETDAHLCRLHLRQLVARGMWSEAVDYVCRFLPPGRGVEVRPLLLFLHTLWALANIAAGSRDGAVTVATQRHDFALCLSICRNTKLRCIVNGILNSPQFRASLDWELMRNKASLIAYDLALESPELRRQVLLPSGPVAPHDVLPVG